MRCNTSVQLNIARDVADSLSVAIQKTMLFEQTRRKAAELEALANVSSALRQAETWNDVITILIKQVMRVVNVSTSVFLWLKKGQLVYAKSNEFSQNGLVEHLYLDADDLIWQVMQSGNATFISDTSVLPRNIPFLPADLQSLALVPMKTVDEIVGALCLVFDECQEFSYEDQQLLISIVDIASNALYRENVLETLEQRVAARTNKLATLYDVASIFSRSMELEQVMTQSLESVLHASGSDAGVIHLWNDTTEKFEIVVTTGISSSALCELENMPLWLWIVKNSRPLLISDLSTYSSVGPQHPIAQKYPAYIGVPIWGKKRAIGVLSIFASTIAKFSNDDISLLTAVADHISVAVKMSRLRNRAKEAVLIEERQRLARDLHDSISQLLYSQVLFADAGRKFAKKDDLDLTYHYLDRLCKTADQAFKEMRLMIYELRPSVLESEGLIDALKHRLDTVEQRIGIEVDLVCEEPVEIPVYAEEGLFRITQEALNNTWKHAAATRVTINIWGEGDKIALEVADNGKGFDPTNISEGMGFSSLRERAEHLGGKLEIDSSPGEGTRVKVTFKQCIEKT